MAGSSRFTVYDRWGNGLFELTDVLAATWTQAVNELDTLEIKTRQAVAKGNAIVWQDSKGIWHEHLVSSVEAEHSTASTAPVNTVYAENSLCEIRGDYIVNKRPGVGVTGGATASEALAAALSASRWSVGAVDVAAKASASLYHTTAWDALSDVVNAWGGEIETALTAGTSGITARELNLKAKVGQQTASRRFEYTRDMSSVKRTYNDTDVITAVYAWGKGEELESGGYGRRIGIASVNGGVDYVADADALALWGRPDGNGGKAHVFGDYTNEDQEDAAALKAEAESYLAERCTPEVTYTADVLQFGAAGVDLTGVSLGDAVHVVDTSFDPQLRIEARIVGMETDLLDPYNPTITLGNFARGLEEQFASIKSTLGGISNRSATWEAMESAAAGYLNRVIDGLNDLFASSGGFVSFDPATGITVTDKDTVEASTMAVNISGAGIRIADNKTSAGDWDWRTFGTGAGFTADEINAGTLTAIRIQDYTGKNYWDLATGELQLTSYDDEISGLQSLVRSTSSGVEVGKVDSSGSYTTNRAVVRSDGYFTVVDKSGNEMARFGADTLSLMGGLFGMDVLSSDGAIKLHASSTYPSVHIITDNIDSDDGGIMAMCNYSNPKNGATMYLQRQRAALYAQNGTEDAMGSGGSIVVAMGGDGESYAALRADNLALMDMGSLTSRNYPMGKVISALDSLIK